MIDNAVYVDGRRVHAPSTLEDTWEAAEASGGMAWLGLYRPDADELRAVADELHLHPLAVEDALEGGERAKLDRYGEDWFMVLHPARYVDSTETVEFGEIGIFTGDRYVVTVRHAEEPDLAAVRRVLETEGRERLALGPWQVTFEILDKVVDDYVPWPTGWSRTSRRSRTRSSPGPATSPAGSTSSPARCCTSSTPSAPCR